SPAAVKPRTAADRWATAPSTSNAAIAVPAIWRCALGSSLEATGPHGRASPVASARRDVGFGCHERGRPMAFEDLKQRHAAMWGSAPFERIAGTLADMHRAIIE